MHANDVLKLSNHDCPITRRILFLTHVAMHIYFFCASVCVSTAAPSQQQSAVSALNFSWLTHHQTFAQAKMVALVAAAILRYILFCCGIFSNLLR